MLRRERRQRQRELAGQRRVRQGRLRFVVEPRSERRVVRRARRSSNVPHETRPAIQGAAHVVLRIQRGLPWLRTPKTYRVLERCFRNGKSKTGFRLIEYSVQQDHLHLVVEADDRRRLSRGVQGLMIRIAKSLNRFWRRRVGRVFADRYFALALVKRMQLWRTLRYVLNNGRKHGAWSAKDRPDPYSSGRWFLRWCTLDPLRRPLRIPAVERPHTFELLALPAIGLDDLPGPRHYDDGESIASLVTALA